MQTKHRGALVTLAFVLASLTISHVSHAQQTPLPPPLFRILDAQPASIDTQPGDRIIVKATIEGKPLLFHLDTGSVGLVMSRASAERLRPIPPDSKVATFDVKMGSVLALNARFGLIDYSAQDGSYSLDGILGSPFFRSNVVQIDFPNRRVAVYPRDSFIPTETMGKAFTINLRTGSPTILGTIGSATIRLLIDTGSAQTFLFPPAAQRAIVGRDSVQYDPIPLGFGETPIAVTRCETKTLTFGQFRVEHPFVFVTDIAPPDMKSAGIDGIIGRDLLHQITMTLDYKDRLIFFKP